MCTFYYVADKDTHNKKHLFLSVFIKQKGLHPGNIVVALMAMCNMNCIMHWLEKYLPIIEEKITVFILMELALQQLQ